jgi:glycosyltransferase involved in cell wall biosynthesis
MRIGVLEWNVASLGGRMRTMLCFADFFKAEGHDVTFYSNFLEARAGYTQENLLEQCAFNTLAPSDFVWLELKRSMLASDVPAAWHALDLLLVPYGGYGYLQDLLPTVRVVCWVIHPAQARSLSTHEIWTNSVTTRDRLLQSTRWCDVGPFLHVVVPPHDYSIFRAAARPWASRQYDAIAVGSLLDAKKLGLFDVVCAQLGLRSVIVGKTWAAAEEENKRVYQTLSYSDLYMNISTQRVADLLGNSKICILPSEAESCPLIVYEALNAGCNILARNVGAVTEQLADCGRVFDDDARLVSFVADARRTLFCDAPARGALFDRAVVGVQTRKRLANG